MNVTTTRVQLSHKHLITPELWSRLVARIVKDEGFDQSLAERIVDQALGFLQLCAADPDSRYAPSPTVDIGWHTFILYTREYAEFCMGLAGRFIHHSPMDEDSETYPGNVISQTTAAMKVRGLAVDEVLWDTVGKCTVHKCLSCTVD